MLTTPYLYPENFGAVADGVTDDSLAISMMLGAVSPGQAPFFSGNYGIGSPILLGDQPIESLGFSRFSAVKKCPQGLILNAGSVRHRAPSLKGFSDAGLVVSQGGVLDVTIPNIIGCGSAIRLAGAPPTNPSTNRIRVQFIAGCNAALEVVGNGSAIQGNRVKIGFVDDTKYGLLFDGSPNCDANAFEMGSFDATQVEGATLFCNTGEGGNQLSNWRLAVLDWLGGVKDAPDGFFASGAFQFCRFYLGNPTVGEGDWGALALTRGPSGANTFECAIQSPWNLLAQYNWMDGPNKRETFGACTYRNAYLCSGAFGELQPGDVRTIYVYSPFCDGGSQVFSVIPTVNPGLEVLEILDNSGVNANEVAITVRNRSGSVIPLGVPFTFIFKHGFL